MFQAAGAGSAAMGIPRRGPNDLPSSAMDQSIPPREIQTPLAISPIAPTTVRAFCRQILEKGDLESKLAPPVSPDGSPLPDTDPGPPLRVECPVRDPGLRMQGGSNRLPKPSQLRDEQHRLLCLSRFAHHELMAVELFAWALLRWPDLPPLLRRGWLAALVDEQRHCRLYLERLIAHGGRFDSDDHSDYFWQQAPAIARSTAGPSAFLSAMGLTLEQANLDFTLTYRDGFAAAGDHESAAVCQLVHDEEIAHVALASRWLARLDSKTMDASTSASGLSVERTELDRYLETVPFPLGPARAKGKRFEKEPRERAGLSEALIEHVRRARSNTEKGRQPDPTRSR